MDFNSVACTEENIKKLKIEVAACVETSLLTWPQTVQETLTLDHVLKVLDYTLELQKQLRNRNVVNICIKKYKKTY